MTAAELPGGVQTCQETARKRPRARQLLDWAAISEDSSAAASSSSCAASSPTPTPGDPLAPDRVEGIYLLPPLRVCAPAQARERSAAPGAEERTKVAEGERNFTAQPRRRRLRINRED